MIRRALLLPLLVLLVLPLCGFADSSSDAPLTLLHKPQDNSRTAQNQPNQQTQPLSSQAEELHDIHGPVPTTEAPPYLLLAGILVVVLLAAAALIWFLKKRGKPASPPTPPWEKALLELADARKLLNPERALVYMDRVSQILRSYIESRFAIQSTRQTTREFLQSLTKIGTNSPLQTHKSALQACLEQADMAKFAHHVPEIKNLEMIEDAVTTFIKKTEPTEPPMAPRQPKRAKRAVLSRRGRS